MLYDNPLRTLSAPDTSRRRPALSRHHKPLLTFDGPCEVTSASPDGVNAFRRVDWSKTSRELPSAPLLGAFNAAFSGSSQFNVRGLNIVLDRLPKHMPKVIVDLRQESHGLVGEEAIGFWVRNNAGNAGKTLAGVLADEAARLDKLRALPPGITIEAWSVVPRPHRSEAFESTDLKMGEVRNEAQLATAFGVGSLRIVMTDREPMPTDPTVDLFLQKMRGLPENTWVHFHCLHGHGRTTLFMAMYDLLHNGTRDRLKTIADRQYEIGGVNLRRSLTTWLFLKRFGAYCRHTDGESNPRSWSHWKRHDRSLTGTLLGLLAGFGFGSLPQR